MMCPIHEDTEMRREHNNETNEYTGYCPKCAKHWPRCRHIHYMEMCDLIRGHDGMHKGQDHGTEWLGDPR